MSRGLSEQAPKRGQQRVTFVGGNGRVGKALAARTICQSRKSRTDEKTLISVLGPKDSKSLEYLLNHGVTLHVPKDQADGDKTEKPVYDVYEALPGDFYCITDEPTHPLLREQDHVVVVIPSHQYSRVFFEEQIKPLLKKDGSTTVTLAVNGAPIWLFEGTEYKGSNLPSVDPDGEILKAAKVVAGKNLVGCVLDLAVRNQLKDGIPEYGHVFASYSGMQLTIGRPDNRVEPLSISSPEMVDPILKLQDFFTDADINCTIAMNIREAVVNKMALSATVNTLTVVISTNIGGILTAYWMNLVRKTYEEVRDVLGSVFQVKVRDWDELLVRLERSKLHSTSTHSDLLQGRELEMSIIRSVIEIRDIVRDSTNPNIGSLFTLTSLLGIVEAFVNERDINLKKTTAAQEDKETRVSLANAVSSAKATIDPFTNMLLARTRKNEPRLRVKAAGSPEISSNESSPKETTTSPEAAKPKAASPEAASPEAASPEAAKPKAAQPKAAQPKAVSTEELKQKDQKDRHSHHQNSHHQTRVNHSPTDRASVTRVVTQTDKPNATSFNRGASLIRPRTTVGVRARALMSLDHR